MSKRDFLQVKGSKVINGRREEIRLRGTALGSWMNIEHFMIGLPGAEQQMRATFRKALGKSGDAFFDTYLREFATEDDFVFLKGLGITCLRLSFNYRHFEDDDKPFEYKARGLRALDRVVGLCRKYRIYAVLDLHAAQGWQNYDWHCDNPHGAFFLYSHAQYQERVARLWQYLARHYRDEEWVAGYDLVNEPTPHSPDDINRLYDYLIPAVRQVDKKHILFLEGDWWSSRWDGVKPRREENIIYSPHYYPRVPGDLKYPGRHRGVLYDRAKQREDIRHHVAFAKRVNRPMWVGETGVGYIWSKHDQLPVFEDNISVLEEAGFHWAVWTYKDVGSMGIVNPAPHTPYQKFLKTRMLKNLHRHHLSNKAYRFVQEQLGRDPNDDENWDLRPLTDRVAWAWQLEQLARELAKLKRRDVLALARSWHFKNCTVRTKTADVISRHCRG